MARVGELVVNAAMPVVRRASASITMRLVGYAIVRSVVGPEGLQGKPWSMSLRTVQHNEKEFRDHFGMTSAEFCERYLPDLSVGDLERPEGQRSA